jgi:heme oxygenase
MSHINTPLHQRLRQATKLAHHDLDHHPLLAPLIRPNLTLDQYGRALEALHAVHCQTEPAILAFLDDRPGLFDYHARRKLAALESDLVALGRAPVRLASALPPPDTLGALIGILYTIEGATQGGQFIARNLHQLPLVNLPTAFFDAYGDLTQQRWNEFLQFAASQCPADEQDLAVAAAVAMFDAIKRHLDAFASPHG